MIRFVAIAELSDKLRESPNPTLTLPDAVNAKSRVHRKFSPY